MKPSQEVEETCRKLKPIIGEKAEKLWYMYLAENEKGRRDIALDIEIAAEKYLKKAPLEKQSILLPPPSVNDSKGKFLLGDVVYNDKILHPLFLKQEDFIKQVGIFAITGEGKSNLAYLLALQLLKTGTPFIVLDWKRSWRNLLTLKDKYPELRQVQVFTIGRETAPFLWNPFRCPPQADKELWINTIAEALEKSHLSGPGVAYYINKIYSNLFKGLAKDFYPNFFDGLEELGKIKATFRELKWKQTAQRIFQSFTIGNASKAFNARYPIKFEELLNKPVILELDLEMPKPLRIFFSEMILRWIHLYRLSQGETENLRHVLFLEEVHNLFNDSFLYKEGNSGLENVYREIRAFGQGIVSITQHPSLLPIYLLGNCHTQLYLGLQHYDDICTARKALFMKPEEEAYPNMLRVGECIVKVKNRIEPCLVKTPLVPIIKGLVNDDWLKVHNLSCQFWKYSWSGESHPGYLGLRKRDTPYFPYSENYDTPSYEQNKGGIPAFVGQNNYGYFAPPSSQNKSFHSPRSPNIPHPYPQNSSVNICSNNAENSLSPEASRLLEDIFHNPLSSISARYKRLRFSGYYGNKLKKSLISQRLVLPRNVFTNKYRTVLFDLTKKGRMVLRDMGHEVLDTSEGIVHKFWKLKIAEYYRSKGFEVSVEETINGRADIVAIGKGKRIAVEIETGKSDYIGNIQRALKAGFGEVVCVGVSKLVEGKMKGEIQKRGVDDERVRVASVLRFDLG